MANSAGALSRAVARIIARRATIVASEKLTDDLVAITLAASGFKGMTWTPGDKLQIAMGSVFDTRTYTPIEWDAENGQTRIIGFAHGRGPGSTWLREAREGDTCDVLGPRHSLDVRRPEGRVALFGDETALGLAYALSRESGKTCSYHFEVGDRDATLGIIERWGLCDADVVARSTGESHLELLHATTPGLVAKGTSFILTGRAQTIQFVKATLKCLDVPSHRVASKAYWAPGKTGLD